MAPLSLPAPPPPDLQPFGPEPPLGHTQSAAPTRVSVIGAGLAGWLVALALARRGAAVTLFGSFEASATALSYGGLLGRAAAQGWRELERRHGPLGWTPARVVLHGWPAPLDRLPPGWQALASWAVPCSRLSIPSLAAALPELARRSGIAWRPDAAVLEVEGRDSGWLLRLAPPRPLREAGDPADADRAPAAEPNNEAAPFPGQQPAAAWAADQVVLAAGAGCRRLWPRLAPRLRCSWAGVLRLDALPERGSPWLEPLRHGALVLPRRWRRPALEARASDLERQEWIVDPGLVPWGAGALLGQISLVRPQSDPQPPPDPTWMEERLRRGLAQLDPGLAALSGRYLQVPVPFCLDGQPLLGPVDDAPGLWICTGFSAPFASLPRQAEALAEALLGSSG